MSVGAAAMLPPPTLSDAIDSFNDDFHGWAHDEQRDLARELLDFAKGQI